MDVAYICESHHIERVLLFGVVFSCVCECVGLWYCFQLCLFVDLWLFGIDFSCVCLWVCGCLLSFSVMSVCVCVSLWYCFQLRLFVGVIIIIIVI